MRPGTGPLASAEDVTKRFGELVVVDGDRPDRGRREVVGLIGANGAGKTTLIRMLLGLLAPTAGRVRLFGEPPSRRTRSRLGYVPQSLGLYEDLTVAENLAFSAAAYGSADARLEGELAEARDTLVRDLPLGLRRPGRVRHRPRPPFQTCWSRTSRPPGSTRSSGPACGRPSGPAPSTAPACSSPPTTSRRPEQCDRLVVLAAGRVQVAAGTLAEIVGDTTAAEVRASARRPPSPP